MDYLPPLFVRDIRSVVGDEFVSVLVSVDGEQPGCCETVADLGAVEAAFHHVDEDTGDIGTVAGVVSGVLG